MKENTSYQMHKFYYAWYIGITGEHYCAYTDNSYYFDLYLRDRAHTIKTSSEWDIGSVCAYTHSDAITTINKKIGGNYMDMMSEIQYMPIHYQNQPFVVTGTEMDNIDEYLSYNDSFNALTINDFIFESVMNIFITIESMFNDIKELLEALAPILKMMQWYYIVSQLTTELIVDCSEIPDGMIDMLHEQFPAREYETTRIQEMQLAFYDMVDYAYNYYMQIVEEDNHHARRELLDNVDRFKNAVHSDET